MTAVWNPHTHAHPSHTHLPLSETSQCSRPLTPTCTPTPTHFPHDALKLGGGTLLHKALRDRGRETDRQTDRQRERERETERQRHRDRDRDRDLDRDRGRGRVRDRDRD